MLFGPTEKCEALGMRIGLANSRGQAHGDALNERQAT